MRHGNRARHARGHLLARTGLALLLAGAVLLLCGGVHQGHGMPASRHWVGGLLLAVLPLGAAAWSAEAAGTGAPPAAPTLRVSRSFVIMPGIYPGVTRAANGDLLVTAGAVFSRSTDGGTTWSKPEEVRVPSRLGVPVGGNGSLGIVTLKDATILWPMNAEKVNQPYTNRECELFVLRSEDHGHTWKQCGPPQRTVPRSTAACAA